MTWWPLWLPSEAVGTLIGGLVVYVARWFSESIKRRHRAGSVAPVEMQENAKTRVELNKTVRMLLARIGALERRDEEWRKEYALCRREYLEQAAKVIRLDGRMVRMQEELDECHRLHPRRGSS